MLREGLSIDRCPPWTNPSARENWRSYAHRRLSGAWEGAIEIPFDHASRIVFFGDSHRGDGSRADAFARNQALFLQVLGGYYDRGFDYIEVGDGDELWKSWRFEDIQRAHAPVFDLLHRFDRQERLQLIVGNHDLRAGRRGPVDKDGMLAREGLILRHARTGQRILVVHGHQADLTSDTLGRMSRFAIGFFWRRLQLLGLVGVNSAMRQIWTANWLERAIMSWAQARGQIVICGHTHRPMSAVGGEAPYFNVGSCVFPGCITGLELCDGEISLVSWAVCGSARSGRPLRLERRLVAPPRRLSALP